MTRERLFSNADCLLALSEERRDRPKNRDDVNDVKLKELVSDLDFTNHCLILRSKNTGSWMNL